MSRSYLGSEIRRDFEGEKIDSKIYRLVQEFQKNENENKPVDIISNQNELKDLLSKLLAEKYYPGRKNIYDDFKLPEKLREEIEELLTKENNN